MWEIALYFRSHKTVNKMFVTYKGPVSSFEKLGTMCYMNKKCLHACIDTHIKCYFLYPCIKDKFWLLMLRNWEHLFSWAFCLQNLCTTLLTLVFDSDEGEKKIVILLVVHVLVQSNILESILHAVCLTVYHALCINFKSVLPGSKLIQVDRCCHAFNVDGVHWDFEVLSYQILKHSC